MKNKAKLLLILILPIQAFCMQKISNGSDLEESDNDTRVHQHGDIVYTQGLHNCPACLLYSPNPLCKKEHFREFNQHVNLIHSARYMFRCVPCGQSFSSGFDAYSHDKKHHQIRTEAAVPTKFQCQFCTEKDSLRVLFVHACKNFQSHDRLEEYNEKT